MSIGAERYLLRIFRLMYSWYLRRKRFPNTILSHAVIVSVVFHTLMLISVVAFCVLVLASLFPYTIALTIFVPSVLLLATQFLEVLLSYVCVVICALHYGPLPSVSSSQALLDRFFLCSEIEEFHTPDAH